MDKVYACIDLKSFYASVECVERGLDPLKTNLVVADCSRTDKTICLAVSPALKKYGIPGRARLFEVRQKVKEINKIRYEDNNKRNFKGKSIFEDALLDKSLELDFVIATPSMTKYMNYSARIYSIYLNYLAKEDIYAYSIDEVFCDITSYLNTYKMSPKNLITTILKEVYLTTGITATAGIGTNMYLAKVAMDIVAKHEEADENGVRIAELDELTYRKKLWSHTPLTDFWRVGVGISKTLMKNGMYTMGDIAYKSLENEELLYKLFGINAEYLIDHAWGFEPCTMIDVKNYQPKANSVSTGQVLKKPYDYEHTKLIIKEMCDALSLELVRRDVITNLITLTIGYDVKNTSFYDGEIVVDRYGRNIPKHSHGTIRLNYNSAAFSVILKHTLKLYEEIINKDLYVRRITICASICSNNIENEQLNLFTNYNELNKEKDRENKEIKLQQTLLKLKNKYGKNSILKAMNLEEGGTMIERNEQVGGHRA